MSIKIILLLYSKTVVLVNEFSRDSEKHKRLIKVNARVINVK